jgi:hypothetical protein
LLALAFESAAIGQNLLRQMARRINARTDGELRVNGRERVLGLLTLDPQLWSLNPFPVERLGRE